MDFKQQLSEYNATLSTLQNQCSEAERQVIVAETNLKNLIEHKNTVIEECEAFAGVSIDQVPTLIEQKKNELTAIMTELSTIDTNGPVTQEKLDAIQAIVDKYAINPV